MGCQSYLHRTLPLLSKLVFPLSPFSITSFLLLYARYLGFSFFHIHLALALLYQPVDSGITFPFARLRKPGWPSSSGWLRTEFNPCASMGRRDKKGANQHNSKHENGVVAPYKKPAKQKSNGNLNGSADGRPKESTPSVQNNSSQNLTVPGETASAAIANASKSRSISSSRQQAAKNLAVSVSDDVEELDGGEAPKSAESQHRKIDVSSARSTTVPEGGSFNLALTVLRSCPIGDTLAILILLLSLPPTLVNFTNLMFAILTFVPPAGSFTTLPSLTDFTSSFSPAAPSVIVLLLIDFLAISIWYLLPLPLIQGILLDCAQATVATTLGGGYSNRPGASDKIVLMVMVVFATHLGRYRKTTLRWLRRTHLIKWLPDLDSFDDVPPRPSYKLGINRSWLDTLQIWLAIHILCQGLTRMVRRSLYTSRSSSFFSSHSRNIDPEAVSNTMAVMEASDGSHNPPNSPSIIKSKSSLQNLREVRDKISSGKRRRKQGNYVRSQQPLWAAFAATKATIMREYEQSQATRDARGSNAEGTKNLGCAPFADEEDRVWITSIDQDKFYFATGPLVPMQPRSTSKKKSDKLEDEAGIDRTKPVYVRINGANWASVKIEELEETEDLDGIIQWVGEVYGLSPASTYRVSFARCGDGVELHSEVIVTPSPPISEQGNLPVCFPPDQAYAPKFHLRTRPFHLHYAQHPLLRPSLRSKPRSQRLSPASMTPSLSKSACGKIQESILRRCEGSSRFSRKSLHVLPIMTRV